MCRFIVLAAAQPIEMHDFAMQFAQMCERSQCLDGDWQGDGWGMAWHDADGRWQRHRSLAPIWTDVDTFQTIPATRHLVMHARAASFAHHKGRLSFNQPYVHGDYAFVFNGMIKGVQLPRKVPGSIGAAKIWSLVREELAHGTPPQLALDRVYAILDAHSKSIQACNMGLSNGQDYVVYNGNPSGRDYYQLYHAQQDAVRLVCSEPFGNLTWQTA